MLEMLRQVPLALTLLRMGLAPVVVALALWYPIKWGFAVCLVAAFLSDVFDGVIARKLNIATPNLRRLDSIADSIFYVACICAAWQLYPSVIENNSAALATLVSLEALRYLYDWFKFGKEASYHMWSSKLWGLALFAGFYSLLALGTAGWAVETAIYAGIVADIEGLVISMILPKWKTDVPSVFHALRGN